MRRSPDATPWYPLGPAPLSGDEAGGVCGAKEPRRRGPCRISPPPPPIPSRPRAGPGAPLPGGNATRSPLPPRTLRASGSGQRSPAAAGERGRTAAGWPVNKRRDRPAVTLPTLPGYRRQGATRHSPCRDSRETPQPRAGPGPRGLGLQTHRLRRARLGSGSRLGSAAARGCVGRGVRAVRAGGARLAKSAGGTGSVAHRPESQ